jgi:hypothetical protein
MESISSRIFLKNMGFATILPGRALGTEALPRRAASLPVTLSDDIKSLTNQIKIIRVPAGFPREISVLFLLDMDSWPMTAALQRDRFADA